MVFVPFAFCPSLSLRFFPLGHKHISKLAMGIRSRHFGRLGGLLSLNWAGLLGVYRLVLMIVMDYSMAFMAVNRH